MARSGTAIEIRKCSMRFTFLPGKPVLMIGGEPMAPTPANIKYAQRLAAEIRQKIALGTFSMVEYFSATGAPGTARTVSDQLDLWLLTQANQAPSTLKGYKSSARFWKDALGTKPLRAVVHSDVLLALNARPDWTGKTRNNKMSVLRQAMDCALLDNVLQANPCTGIKNASHQTPDPEPLSVEEVELVLGDMRKHYPAQVTNYFEFKFFTGLRTGESLGIKWGSIDWRRKTMTVSEGITMGLHRKKTKTSETRTVQLNSRAMAALQAQKQFTFMAGEHIFVDPVSGERWRNDEPPRKTYWMPTLKRLGIRYRSPYETRHTYATMLLMAGARMAWAAKQLGHSIEVFSRKYARWIDGPANDFEIGKVEDLLTQSASAPRIRQAGT